MADEAPKEVERDPETKTEDCEAMLEDVETQEEPRLKVTEKVVKCIQCEKQDSLMWRSTELGEICNECYEENKLSNSQEHEPYNTRNGSNTATADTKQVRKSTRTTRFKAKYMVNLKNMIQGNKGRRNISKPTPFKAPSVTATTTTTDSLFYKGTYFQVGDIVSLMDEKDDIYYAQIRGLMQDSFCEKSACITWLIPTTSSPDPNEKFDASTYLIGPEEDLARNLSCMNFVMHAPSNYYHDKTTPYPPPDILQEDNQLSKYCGFIWKNIINEPS